MPGNNSCQSCSEALSPSVRFCPECGSEQVADNGSTAETVTSPETQPAHCVACGGPVGPANKFCPACGAPRQDAATLPSQGTLERITTERLTDATTGEFDILERVGHGAMGSVYLARDVALTRRVAIKVISPHLLQDESMVARFRLEAQTVAALRHPHIVSLYSVREVGDLHFFIMDFIEGPSLRSLIKAHGPLDIGVTQALLFQIGSALSYAHRRGRGVIHRDVKPANVMVDREGNAVVMDFGISKVGASQSGLTQTGATIGTPEYMSPEQCMDGELTGASDQYALGIVAYEMLTGAVPFKGSTYVIMMAHADGTPPSIHEQRPDCPPQVEAAVMRMLAKSPDERFPDLEEAVEALGGKPLGHREPVRDAIVTLVDSVSNEIAGLDESSPLSPVPGSRDTAPRQAVAEIHAPPRSTQIEVEESRAAAGTAPREAVPAPKGPAGRGRVWIAAAALIVVALGLSQVARFGATPEVTDSVTLSPPAVADTPTSEDTPESTVSTVSRDSTPDVVASEDTPTSGGGAEDPGPGAGIDSTESAPPGDVVATRPVVSSVRIEGGDRVVRVGARAPISASALTGDGESVDDVPVQWSSSASDVAIVRGDQLVADAAGSTVITATVEGVVGSVGVRVLALPSRDEVGAMLQERFVDLLRRRDTGAVERILGQGGRAALQREIVQRMQEPNFGARMTRMGDVTPSGPGVAMEFDLRLSWRDGAGAQVQPPAASFRAMLEPTAAGWRIAGVNRLRR